MIDINTTIHAKWFTTIVHIAFFYAVIRLSNILIDKFITKIVKYKDDFELKNTIKDKLKEMGIMHSTLEMENREEECTESECVVTPVNISHQHHHHE